MTAVADRAPAPLTNLDVVLTLANRWRSLRVWGAPLPAAVRVKTYKRGALGYAWPGLREAEVRVTERLVLSLSTALHELAHLAAPNQEMHGPRWRRLYMGAVAEATGTDPDLYEIDVALPDLRAQAVAALDAWLTRSGQRAVLATLPGVKL